MPPHSFWLGLSGRDTGAYNDLMFLVLRFNDYTGSNTDMYADWREDGSPTLVAVT